MLMIPSFVVRFDSKAAMETDSGAGLIDLLNQLNKTLFKRTSEELLGMRVRQFLALSKVRDHPGISQQELAEMMLLDANAVVLLLNELEEAGYSLRRRDPADRRRHIVGMFGRITIRLVALLASTEHMPDSLLYFTTLPWKKEGEVKWMPGPNMFTR